ncbi:MAG: iron chelate uptake ABC transporter family permease subunit [Thermoflexaceae bacterium]|nr:iron chelate uptake ABC transporter family permease subunit [Thermoflexaceae bacterium]
MTVRGEARVAVAARRGIPRPRVTAFAAGFALLAVVVVLSASIGAVGIPPRETATVIAHHLHLPGASTPDFVADRIVWDVRLPRVLTAGIVGATLAASGVAYQGVFATRSRTRSSSAWRRARASAARSRSSRRCRWTSTASGS